MESLKELRSIALTSPLGLPIGHGNLGTVLHKVVSESSPRKAKAGCLAVNV